MLRTEPVEPSRPEKNELAKFELIKAMGVAIAAIAKEKAVFINSATIEENDHFEVIIKVHVASDKETWDNYSNAKSEYNVDYSNWVHERDCEKYGITEDQRVKAEEAYYAYRKESGYPYPDKKSREDFYREAGTKKSGIIEVL